MLQQKLVRVLILISQTTLSSVAEIIIHREIIQKLHLASQMTLFNYNIPQRTITKVNICVRIQKK